MRIGRLLVHHFGFHVGIHEWAEVCYELSLKTPTKEGHVPLGIAQQKLKGQTSVSSCVILSKLDNLSVLQFPSL